MSKRITDRKDLIRLYNNGLYNNEINDEQLQQLIREKSEIDYIQLHNVDYKLMGLISNALLENNTVTKLIISGNTILYDFNTQILDLELNNNRMINFDKHTNLNRLKIHNCRFDESFSSYIKNHTKLRFLCINEIEFIDPKKVDTLFECFSENKSITRLAHLDSRWRIYSISDNVKSLQTKMNMVLLQTFINSTTLEELIIEEHNGYPRDTAFSFMKVRYNSIFDNTSIISLGYLNKPDKITIDWLNRNRRYRWKYQHSFIVDVYIGLVSKSFILPPYVFLEIYDWLYPNNRYTTHLQKITLIQNLQHSIQKIWDI